MTQSEGKTLTLGSLFDGIGGWQLAAIKAGVKPIWSSEIEAFPLAVTKLRYPETIQLGDITKIDGAKIPPVDIICMGSPCQDLSIAGKREGLQGERSGLFRVAVRLIRSMRVSTGGVHPRFVVWENVPGAFTSNEGMDFRAVLEEYTESEIPIPKSGKWSPAGMVRGRRSDVAWRTLDAQYWGVAQRRARIFLVADFAETGRCAAEILFKSESMYRDFAEGEAERERIANAVEESVGGARRGGIYDIRISSDGTVNQRAHCYETDICRSLDTHAPDPNTNHGGPAILENQVVLNDQGGGGAERINRQDRHVESAGTWTSADSAGYDTCKRCYTGKQGKNTDIKRKDGYGREPSTASDGEYP